MQNIMDTEFIITIPTINKYIYLLFTQKYLHPVKLLF